jgi:hypothetical protein
MNTKLIANIVLIGIAIAFTVTASAQFPINIPKLPKIKKDKPQTTAPSATPSPEAVEKPTTAADSPVTKPAGAATESAAVDCSQGAVGIFRENMETTLREAEEYKPGLREYYVQQFNDRRNEYLLAAISPNFRREWLGTDSPEQQKCYIPLLDAIAAAAKRTLPTYHATSSYVAAAPADRKILLGVIDGVAKATVYKAALKPGTWEIGKDSYNYPVSRYRYGEIWLKWPHTDDGYCRIYYVNLVQDYAGGGRYGGSYARHVSDEPAGCPAGE